MASVRWIISTAPEIFLLLAVAIGTILGRAKVRGFAIGTTVCTLIVAVLTAQLGPFTFPPVLRGVLFSLFAFTIGYRSAPEFFASLSERTCHLWRARRRHDGRRAVTGCGEIAESQTPVLGAAAPYAIGNVVLTVLGLIIVDCTFVG